MITDIIIIGIVLFLVGMATWYIRKEKKRGVKCIGCSVEGCAKRNSNTECNCEDDNEKSI